MWVGSVLFAIVLSEVEGFVSRHNQNTFARKINVDDVASFLKKESVPRDLQMDIIEWIDSSYCVERERLEQQEIVKRLPSDLQERLIVHLTKSLFEGLPVLTTIPANERDAFLALLSRGARLTLVRRSTIVATYAELREGHMFVVVSGRVRITSAGIDDHDLGSDMRGPILVRGDFFGSFNVLEAQTGEVCSLLFCCMLLQCLISFICNQLDRWTAVNFLLQTTRQNWQSWIAHYSKALFVSCRPRRKDLPGLLVRRPRCHSTPTMDD